MRKMAVFVVLVFLVTMLGGCAKFSASRKMETGPFGENVSVMMGDVASELASNKPFHIRKYLYGPNLDEYLAEWANMRKTMRGIVLYSTQVVNISQSNLIPDRKKPNALADTLRAILEKTPDDRMAEVGLKRDEMMKMGQEVADQDNMLDALAKAQPLVDHIANYVDNSFMRVEMALTKVINDVNERMDTRWALNRANVESLLALQGRTIKSYSLLYQYREGDAGALDLLRENDPALVPVLGKGRTVGDKELETTEAQIMARLKNLTALREQLMPQVEQYLTEARERDQLYQQHKDTGKKLRTTVMLWARAHRNLAAGIPVPPEIDLYSVLIGAAKKALPLP